MTKGTIQIPVESVEYNFVLVEGLKKENTKLKNALKEVYDVLTGGVPNTEWIKRHIAETLELKK